MIIETPSRVSDLKFKNKAYTVCWGLSNELVFKPRWFSPDASFLNRGGGVSSILFLLVRFDRTERLKTPPPPPPPGANTKHALLIFSSNFTNITLKRFSRRCHLPKRVRCYLWRVALGATHSLRVLRTARYACGICATLVLWQRPRIVRRGLSVAAAPYSCVGWGKRPW